MKTDDHKCIVELNSTEITCAIAKINNDKSITIISHSKVESKGIHNGTIVNSLEVTKALRTCLSIAEEKAGIVLKKVNLIVETTELSCTRLSKYRKIGGSKIHKDDIVFLLKEAKKEINLNDNKSSIIHIFNHNYVVDGKEFIKEPIDIYADQLSHEMTFITMSKNAIKNFNEIFINCDLEIERIISKNFALAVNCLNNTDLHLGATLINMELDKTSIGVFKSFALINYVVFPIGINHIAKDISRLCSVTINEAS